MIGQIRKRVLVSAILYLAATVLFCAFLLLEGARPWLLLVALPALLLSARNFVIYGKMKSMEKESEEKGHGGEISSHPAEDQRGSARGG